MQINPLGFPYSPWTEKIERPDHKIEGVSRTFRSRRSGDALADREGKPKETFSYTIAEQDELQKGDVLLFAPNPMTETLIIRRAHDTQDEEAGQNPQSFSEHLKRAQDECEEDLFEME